jgi:hypothetical protein
MIIVHQSGDSASCLVQPHAAKPFKGSEMIDDHALARSRDPEILALGELMERVLRWMARQDTSVIKSLVQEIEDDIEDLVHRDVSSEHRQIAEAAFQRQRELLSIARIRRLPDRLQRL